MKPSLFVASERSQCVFEAWTCPLSGATILWSPQPHHASFLFRLYFKKVLDLVYRDIPSASISVTFVN